MIINIFFGFKHKNVFDKHGCIVSFVDKYINQEMKCQNKNKKEKMKEKTRPYGSFL